MQPHVFRRYRESRAHRVPNPPRPLGEAGVTEWSWWRRLSFSLAALMPWPLAQQRLRISLPPNLSSRIPRLVGRRRIQEDAALQRPPRRDQPGCSSWNRRAAARARRCGRSRGAPLGARCRGSVRRPRRLTARRERRSTPGVAGLLRGGPPVSGCPPCEIRSPARHPTALFVCPSLPPRTSWTPGAPPRVCANQPSVLLPIRNRHPSVLLPIRNRHPSTVSQLLARLGQKIGVRGSLTHLCSVSA